MSGWRRWVSGLGAWAIVTCALGEVPPAQPAGLVREDIAAQRQAVERTHAAEVAACYQQFFVNDCTANARRKRSEAMAEFKRQEVMLNDAARRAKTAEQVGKREERLSVERQEEAARQRTERTDQVLQKQQGQDQRAAQRQQTGVEDIPTVNDKGREARKEVSTPVRKSQPPSMPTPRNPDPQSALNDFNLKQQEAEQRKADLEKSRRERTKPLANPLPATGAASSPLPPGFTRP